MYGVLPLSIPDSKTICPIIGTPAVAKYYDNTNTEYKGKAAFYPIQTDKGDILWEERLAKEGRITYSQNDAEQFVLLYEKTCAESFKDKLAIPYFAAKAKQNEKRKARLDELSFLLPGLKTKVAELSPKVEKQESIITAKKETLTALESEISANQPKLYTIVGDVIRKENNRIFLFGTSVSYSSSDKIADPGFGAQCNFELDKLESTDYLSPKLSTKVKVDNVVFIKESQAENRFGQTVRLLHFQRHPSYSKSFTSLVNKKESLLKEIEILNENIRPTRKELSDAQSLVYEYEALLESENAGK